MEAIRAGIVLLVTQMLNLLVLLGVVALSAEQLTQINLVVGTASTVFFLVFKQGSEEPSGGN
jgi:hypothetical protein